VERETRRSAGSRNWVRGAGFLGVFGPKFLRPWSMKIKSIYRRWKRDDELLVLQEK